MSPVQHDSSRYRRLVERSADGICVCHSSRLEFVNAAAAVLFGAADRRGLVGRTILDLVHENDQGRVGCSIDRLRSRQLPAFRLDVLIARLDGRLLDAEIAGSLLDDEPGGEPEIALTVRDLTERKRTEAALRESEERLTLAFAGAQEGVWDWNLETGAVVYSPRWKQMLGYADDDPLIEPHVSAWERLLHPDDRGLADELSESVTRGARFYEGEFRLRHKDGHYIHVLSRGFPVRRYAGGPAVRIVGTHFDLTERRKAEAERTRTELLARLVFAQEDERRRVSREMHDRLGEQLTALARRIGILKAACAGDQDLQDDIRALETISQRLDEDVDRLVWELRPTALDDLGLRAALANYLQDWSERVAISAELHSTGLLDDRLPSEVETTLYRIAQEALTNVARHSGARKVDVILQRRDGQVLLVVEDDGVGFDAEAADPDRRGFGLLGMQERAALVGATLEIESGAGAGTTVLVRIDISSRQDAGRLHD